MFKYCLVIRSSRPTDASSPSQRQSILNYLNKNKIELDKCKLLDFTNNNHISGYVKNQILIDCINEYKLKEIICYDLSRIGRNKDIFNLILVKVDSIHLTLEDKIIKTNSIDYNEKVKQVLLESELILKKINNTRLLKQELGCKFGRCKWYEKVVYLKDIVPNINNNFKTKIVDAEKMFRIKHVQTIINFLFSKINIKITNRYFVKFVIFLFNIYKIKIMKTTIDLIKYRKYRNQEYKLTVNNILFLKHLTTLNKDLLLNLLNDNYDFLILELINKKSIEKIQELNLINNLNSLNISN